MEAVMEEQFTKTGVRILSADAPLPWTVEAGVVESETKPIASLVRFRIFGRSDANKGKILLVFNAGDTSGDRPAAFGVPGGTVEGKETPRQALLHEQGEIPFAIVSDPGPGYAYQYDATFDNRVERIVVFDVEVDEEHPIAISEEEGQEVSKARFFSFDEALALPIIDTRPGAPALESEGIYFSHARLIASWQWMARYGARCPADAFKAEVAARNK